MAKDVTPHVLRHSFASLGADLGMADSTIAGLIRPQAAIYDLKIFASWIKLSLALQTLWLRKR